MDDEKLEAIWKAWRAKNDDWIAPGRTVHEIAISFTQHVLCLTAKCDHEGACWPNA
jgi:hypothetical protein